MSSYSTNHLFTAFLELILNPLLIFLNSSALSKCLSIFVPRLALWRRPAVCVEFESLDNGDITDKLLLIPMVRSEPGPLPPPVFVDSTPQNCPCLRSSFTCFIVYTAVCFSSVIHEMCLNFLLQILTKTGSPLSVLLSDLNCVLQHVCAL